MPKSVTLRTALCAMALAFPLRPASAAPQPACAPAHFRLALDIGHYLAAPGATSATGVTELSYNQALAHRVVAALTASGFTAITLIGESGAPLRLEERTRIAAAAGAVLFVSLHHDSVQPQYLTDWMVDGKPQRYSDRFHGYSIFVSDRNRYPAESREFATLLGDALRGAGMTPSLHHAEAIPHEGRPLLDPGRGIYRFDDLVVLRTATMPAALLESAIIVNRAEEEAVRNGTTHGRVVGALVKAITAYCGLHPTSG